MPGQERTDRKADVGSARAFGGTSARDASVSLGDRSNQGEP
jgi:hypothetical protein